MVDTPYNVVYDYSMTALSIPQLVLSSIDARGGAFFFKKPVPEPTSGDVLVKIYRTWFRVSELGRFFVSGNLGNLCFYFLERLVYSQLSQISDLPAFVEEYIDSVSFFIGYILQIITQHLLHALLVYGLDSINTREKYFKTLLGQFSAYGFALIGSTVLNLILLNNAGLDKSTAFVTTMVIFAGINYFLIGWIVRRTTASVDKKKLSKRFSRKNKFAFVGKIGRGGGYCKAPCFSRCSLHDLVVRTAEPINIDDINQVNMHCKIN